MILYKTRKKTNEELYEGNIRSDFRTTKQYPFAICIEEFCLLLKGYYGKV